MPNFEDHNIQTLLDKYEEMLYSGKRIYLDADEFEILFDYYDSIEDIESARELLASGLEIHPGSEGLMLRQARLMMYDYQYEETLNYLNSNFSGYDFDMYLLKIECYLQLESYNQALKLSEEVLNDENEPESVILSELGSVYVEADYFDEAILYLEKSLEFDSDNLSAINDLAYAFEMKSNFEKAILYTNKILDIDPYSFEAWFNLGKLYSFTSQYEKAIDALDFALSINDSDISTLILKAHCLSLSGQPEEAINLFKECLLFKPDDPGLYSSLIDVYLLLERWSDVLRTLDEWEEIDSSSDEFLSKKIFALLRMEQLDKAELFLEEAKERVSSPDSLLPAEGEIFFQKQEFEKAQEIFEKANSLMPDNIFVNDRLATLYIVAERFNQALALLENLQENSDELSFVYFRMAFIYLETGQRDKLNKLLDSFSEEQLKSLLNFFVDDDWSNFDISDRQALINRLNDISEIRILFKNLKY
ncbi:MAG: hypothetical protein QM654_00045 [Dysgonamonadaceae bacterium]